MVPQVFAHKSPEFHLEEYKALREEVIHLLETLRSLERNVIVAIGATWGFLIEKGKDAPRWSWFIPFLFAVLGALRVRGILKFFGQLRAYIGRLEEAFNTNDGPEGWHHFTRPIPPRKKITDGTVPLWALLLLVTLAAAIWEGVVVPFTPAVKPLPPLP